MTNFAAREGASVLALSQDAVTDTLSLFVLGIRLRFCELCSRFLLALEAREEGRSVPSLGYPCNTPPSVDELLSALNAPTLQPLD